jgi:hypothetical protein
MLALHVKAATMSVYVRREKVPMNRLDDVCPVSQDDRVLLKIDVQDMKSSFSMGHLACWSAAR